MTEPTDAPKIEPCPVCGGVGEPITLFDKPYISCTVTEHSPYLLPLAEWNRLSQAMQLLVAVEKINAACPILKISILNPDYSERVWSLSHSSLDVWILDMARREVMP